jgi:conjugative relaxase-like TrwC/TraI family protein
MLSYAKVQKAEAAAAYFAKYYAREADGADGEPAGRWESGVSDTLGLSGEVRREELEAVLRGIDPRTGEPLGDLSKKHVAGHDLTFSAPKTVSTVWALATDERRAAISAAHERAVSAGISYLRAHAIHTRLGRGGRERGTADALIARFQHSTSRANDPQLHTHCVVANRARGPEGDWRAVDIDLRAVHAAGAAYRAELARELQAQGFAVTRKNDRGEFELAGPPAELTKAWSKRRGDVLSELRASERAGAAASNLAASVSRREKENPNRSENFARWRAEAGGHGFDAGRVEALARGAARITEAETEPPRLTDAELVGRAMGNRVAVDPESLRRTVLQDAVGRERPAEALARADRMLAGLERVEREDARGRIVEAYTTRELVERERQMLADAACLATSKNHGLDATAIEAQIRRAGLVGQQADMVRHLTDGRGLANVEGWAGTGKTYTVRQVAEVYERAGYQVRGCAVAGRAAVELKSAGIEDSTTIARLRIDVDAGRVELTRRTVLIIDEAGMMGSRDAADLYRRAAAAGAKIIQIGDTKQLAPVEAGAPYRDTVRLHGAFELREVRRQVDEVDREIARFVREQRPEEARAAMQEGGQWHVTPKVAEAVRATARAYADERAAGRDSLMVASLRADVARLNADARAALRECGVIYGDDVPLDTKAGELRVAAGDRLMFTERCDALRAVNGTKADVISASPDEMRLRMDDGRTVTLKLHSPWEVEAVRERLRTAEKAVEAAKSDRDRGIERAQAETKGTPSAAKAWEAVEQLRRQVERATRDLTRTRPTAERVEAEYGAARGLVHGHAATVHKSQGATVRGADHGGGTVHVLLRDHRLTDSNAGYVALSRNTGKAHVYVSAAEEAGAVERLREAARIESLADYRPSTPRAAHADPLPSHSARAAPIEQRDAEKIDGASRQLFPTEQPAEIRVPLGRDNRSATNEDAHLSAYLRAELARLRGSPDPEVRERADRTDAGLRAAFHLRENAMRVGDSRGIADAEGDRDRVLRSFFADRDRGEPAREPRAVGEREDQVPRPSGHAT